MEAKLSQAIEAFRHGLNCSQSVFSVYCDELKIDKRTALSIACGFGAGMGRLQETCGAVTGAFMVLSVFACQKYTDNAERKNQSYALIQEFDRRFVAAHGSIKCSDLIKYDLRTPEGRQLATENNFFQVVCENCITNAIAIVDDLIKN
jgi:C_GCAxxG_C_C family probable redox protein